ncbi:TRAP transporter large permease [Polaromonas sp. CG_9.11]|uniref:TRAP transporter large permease n=1 Tax=Polaromonas sp. CG_9.11 TaxID=2787730 RepID=UPI0018CBC217|nr:TRAP transporter large permease [Polaromonas sp. CG_9.11]MBG6077537.1 tripartite ATP-independent transporter DctM subunit [Polaromonas sp. CG_9.11]
MSQALMVLLGMLVVTLVLRLPIGFGMLISGVSYLVFKRQDLGLVAEQVLNGLYNSYILLAVPLFIFAASVMNSGTVSERLFDFALAIVGRLRGGLAHVNIIVSVIFSGMSGSAIADAAGPGIVSIRMMQKNGYSAEFAGALTAASSTIGPIIPPSIPLVIYAMVSGASVGALFLGGVVPGLLMAVALMLAVQVVAAKRNLPRGEKMALQAYPRILLRGILPLTLPVVLLGGIYTGIFTPTEAASVAALYALFLSSLVYRALSWRRLYEILVESSKASASVTLIIASAFVINYAFTAENVPGLVAAWLTGMELSPLGFLLLVNVLFLVLGCFLDTSIMLLVLVPILLPTAKLLGIDLVHLGVVLAVNMMIGLVTPPFGMLLFVINALAGVSLKGMIREAWLFIGVLLVALVLMTLFPQIVLWLPHQMGYGGK